jgi:acyl carrier protein
MPDTIYLEIINATIPYAAHGPHRSIQLTDPSTNLLESGLDSMDVAVLGAYLCELFDIPFELQKEMPSDNVHVMFTFLHQHGRRILHTAAEVQEMLGPCE